MRAEYENDIKLSRNGQDPPYLNNKIMIQLTGYTEDHDFKD
jgi:hypothetical protein